MDWIATCDRLDHILHDEGVPDDLRMKAMAQIMTTLARVNKVIKHRECEMQAAELLHLGSGVVMARQGISRATVYNRAKRGRLSRVGCVK